MIVEPLTAGELCYDCTARLLGSAVGPERNHFFGKVPPGQAVLDICDGCGIHRFDHEGVQGSGGRDRTCALAGNNRASSQLDHAGTDKRSGGSRTRTCERMTACARATR